MSNSPKVTRTKFLGSDKLFCFINISKFGSFKNPFATFTRLSQLHFGCRRYILLAQMNWFLWVMVSRISTFIPWHNYKGKVISVFVPLGNAKYWAIKLLEKCFFSR